MTVSSIQTTFMCEELSNVTNQEPSNATKTFQSKI